MNDLLLAWGLMTIATLSPGPANLAITATALADGQRAALATAAGISTVSLGWGLAAAAGLTSLLERYGWSLTALRGIGGAYLLWLAWRALRSALRRDPVAGVTGAQVRSDVSPCTGFRRGALLHLTNPKPVFAWLAVIAVGVGDEVGVVRAATVVVLCWCTAAAVFTAYAIVFSVPAVARAHARLRRPIDAAVAMLFGAAGARLIATGD